MGDALLQVRDVHLALPAPGGPRAVLAGVDLRVERGSFTCVVGPSGCGKSTLLGVVAGLRHPDRGQVLLDGRDVTGTTGHAAWMPQDDLLLEWRTVVDNVALGLQVQGLRRREARARVRDLLAGFGLAEHADARPSELSGGLRQRAALARTVVQGRDVLLLDEPFGALDALTRLHLQRWLAATWAAHRWTVVMVTHDVREAVTLADEVVRLSDRPARVAVRHVVDDPHPRHPAALGAGTRRVEAEVLAGLGVLDGQDAPGAPVGGRGTPGVRAPSRASTP
ncbi:ABC transporter ATP-binding protein [Cellulomonas dongxiuzhuiae]|uniref:ABC transporter ATP-binding protein n=1 Tax=Cellulomonas dongxiuzhuiae TaxID=2819979 RepID=A0ABX8GHT4_9CELL|nr:ABC transporter ATP-binding protein [Cellulomonas dongxiuzhuiae]MBO3088094.1 ABC transporter ATP-binding protein [Cellulomonas dongxiuzhuiae]MBO3094559.1 ABC transporter ATP-binding protein [Cellulomonas dongxiuzhuiae]QWC15579.1 ABC transporter ATP-binding protein [Cellulomonas dongxiuzhuiae]